MSQKKYYMDTINLLVPIATFTGGLTIILQFFIPCSEPHIASLLALASELFLASLAGLSIVFLLLYGFWDTDVIYDGPKPAYFCGHGWGRHSLAVAQIAIVGLMMIAAFLVLSVAVIIFGNRWTGGFGIVLLTFLFVAAVMVGVMIGKNKYVRVDDSLPGPFDPVPIHNVQRHLTTRQGFALALLLILELIILVMLLGVGIWQAVDPPSRKCDTNNLAVQWPSSTLAISEVNPQTNPLATFTNTNTVLSITLTNNEVINSQVDTILTMTSTQIFTTVTTTIDYKLMSSTSPNFSQSLRIPISISPATSIPSSPYYVCSLSKTAWPSFITSVTTTTIPCTTELSTT